MINLEYALKIELFEKMLLIREFEISILKLFEEGKIFGTTHTYIGQEANAVGILTHLSQDDVVISNHRCHGHYLVYRDDPYALYCEMMGKTDGTNSGRGGSQHIHDGNFFSNGIQGGIVPFALGFAKVQKLARNKNITVVFLGDGTMGQGVVYEGLNLASKWNLPILFIVENNRYAQSTNFSKTLAGNFSDRFAAFGIDTFEMSSFDVENIYLKAGEIISNVRSNRVPGALILNTYRFEAHSKSDDGRNSAEVEKWKASSDCITLFQSKLMKEDIRACETNVESRLMKAQSSASEIDYSTEL